MATGQVLDLRGKPNLMLLGGVPRSGKTLLSGVLWNTEGVVSQSLDATVSGLMSAAPQLGINWSTSPDKDAFMAHMAKAAAESGLAKYGRLVLEGESITPWVANNLRDHFDVNACFLVLTTPSIAKIEAHERENAWVHLLDAEERARLLENLTVRSEQIAADCKTYGFACIDMSAGTYEQQMIEAATALMRQFSIRV